jgi:hypothetical protein
MPPSEKNDEAMQSATDVQSNFLDIFHSITVDTFLTVQWSFYVTETTTFALQVGAHLQAALVEQFPEN